MTITRRAALTTGAALPLAALVPAHLAAQTATPTPEAPAMPLHHSFPLGSMRITVLLAGRSPSDNPHGTFGLNASEEEFVALSRENFIPSDRAMGNFCPVVVEAGNAVILFDTGLNPEGLKAALASAGMGPETIRTVVITHMHGDHIGGLSADGALTFPDVDLVTGKAEMAHWSQAGNETFEAKVRPFIDDFRLLEDGEEVVPGIRAMLVPGHTPGHMAFMLTEDGGQRLMLTADTANHYVWSLARPEWEVRFDMDKPLAIESRKKVLAMLAEERIPFIGHHMPFPAVGYVAKTEDGYRFMPETYQFELAAE
ncbi:MBL fold metallo-hydrolase [Falsirhodobacter sp. 20TX0035]|uniref:MBL fold metallo-hydrolase n=1 Tax=Falsirhodobacter sp. 20TX0035 TaxID=3022019 RepID=UPI00232D5F07|nr:MBL fold metallo-hydrolase [Falsirhodobacter sp. 20TX0035]MDB6452379.1 MBL fold metallo-hydrolase [Falsirhodobacter sp. 20TX0035]